MDMTKLVSPMPQELALQLLPYSVVKMIHGAEVIPNYQGNSEFVCLFFNSNEEVLHVKDFERVKRCAEKVWQEDVVTKRQETAIGGVPSTLELHRRAYQAMIEEYKPENRLKLLMLLSDQYGCGYWRMALPATYFDDSKIKVDSCTLEVVYDYLKQYDVIMVQRICNWGSFYIIRKLQAIGKKIVYDIDDNLFEMPETHVAYRRFGPDERESSRAIMRIVDAITVTTEAMKNCLVRNVGKEIESKIHVIPNAIDVSTFKPRLIYPINCSDKNKPFRIMWTGSATHEADFNVCLEALDRFLYNHRDDDQIRVLFMGYLPVCIAKLAMGSKHWQNRLEHIEFKDIETYFCLMKKVYADVGIAPLQHNPFNDAKSCVKWIEYTMSSIPTIASAELPYTEVITNGVNGILASNTDEWLAALEEKYLKRTHSKWNDMVSAAKLTVGEKFDINKTSGKQWTDLFLSLKK